MRWLAPLALTLGLAGPAFAVTPLPEVSAPIPETAASHAFGGAAHTLKPEKLSTVGYVEEERLVSGEANVYDWPAPGPAVVRTADVPYTTRILIRRPARAGKFSGRVIVEMLNPSSLFDLNIGWAIHRDEIVRRGDAWAGITAKPVAVATLKAFDPQRYAALNWKNPLPLDDSRNCQVRGQGDSRETENGLVWDINTQVAAWLRSEAPTNAFFRGRVKRLYGWGYSQTGGFLYTYINAVAPLARKAGGRPPFDGYFVAVSGGPSPINQCATPVPQDDPRRIIENAGVPVIHVMSQSDYLPFAPLRRPDSDTLAHRYRHYDIAGSGHATPDELYWGPQPADLVKAGRAVPPVGCNEGPRSRFPSRVGFNALLRALVEWTEEGRAPPPGQSIVVKDGQPVLDTHGNVTGGVRSPYVDVPTATWAGNSTGPSFCRIAGHERAFDAAKLKALYPTKAAYVDAIRKNVAALVAARYVTPEDGKALVAEAQAFLP